MIMNQIQLEDCQSIGNMEFIDWKQFEDSTILITGSTGLIGQNLVNAIAYNSNAKSLNIKLILLVRNIEAAEKLFAWTGAKILFYQLGEEFEIGNKVDYIVHLASPTNSKYFVEKPVDTLLSNIDGYCGLLKLAKKQSVKKFIGISTMEVYGYPEKGHKVKENELGAFETLNARNSYPISKIACEALCNGYYLQYGVPTVILRATQTFGPGVKYDDSRVFAEFMRCVIEKRNIVLKTAGLTERSYLYTADAVSAILVSLLKANPGQAYTIANPDTYCSIKNMAQMVAKDVANGSIKVESAVTEDIEKLGYAGTLFMDLDIEKMESLGWKPSIDLKTMFERMILSFQEQD